MEIRLAVPEDIQKISAVFEHFYTYNAGQQPQYYRQAAEEGGYPLRIIENRLSDLYVALDGGAIIGLMHVEEKITPPNESIIPHRYADIVALFVDPTYRGQGVGDRLIRAAKKWAKGRKLNYLELFVLAENEGGLGFYKKAGFETVSFNMRMPL
jgi:ribosomal protein S18 acetylase RimI-like enzyme